MAKAFVALVLVAAVITGLYLLRGGPLAPGPVAPTVAGGGTASPAGGRVETYAGPSLDGPAAVERAGTGVITGLLLRSRTDAPIPGAVAAHFAAGTRTLAVGNDGAFRLDGLPRGVPLRFEATSPGLLPYRIPRLLLPAEGEWDLAYVHLGAGVPLDVLAMDGEGTPVEGVALELERTREWWNENDHAPPAPEAAARTDAGGTAAFADLPPGPWLLRAAAPGFATIRTDVVLVEGALRGPVRLVLAPGHPIEGRVLHADGTPAGSLRVSAITGGEEGAAPATAVTDAAGRFRMEGLLEGVWNFQVPLGAEGSEGLGTRSVPAEAPVEFRLAPRAGLSGRVLAEPGGAGIEGARVQVSLSGGGESGIGANAAAVTGPDGAWSLAGLPAFAVGGAWASKEGWLPAPPPEGTVVEGPLEPGTVRAFDLRLRRGDALTGVVRERDGKPIPAAWVRVMGMDSDGNFRQHGGGRTDGEGRYRFSALEEGRYLFQAGARNRHLAGVPDDFWELLRSGELPEECSVTVPAEGEATKDLVLVPDSRVEGRFVFKDGKPAAGVVPSLESDGDAPGGGLRGPASGPDGSFFVEDLAPATGVVLAAYGPEGRIGVSAPFDLVESEVTRGIVVTLAAPCTLAGRVLGPDGKPAKGATLRLVAVHFDPDQPWEWEWRSDGGTRVPVAADGSWRSAGLAPGKWTPVAAAPGHLEERGEGVEAAEGEVREGLAVTLRVALSIAGTVTGPGGAPVAGARVEAMAIEEDLPEGEQDAMTIRRHFLSRQNWGNDDGSVTTDAAGKFRIGGLAAGKYTITASKEGLLPASAPAETGGGEVALRLGEGLPISGRVLEAGTRAPVAGVRVQAQGFRMPGPAPASEDEEDGRETVDVGTETAADGTFTLVGLPPGNGWLDVEDGQENFRAKRLRNVAAGAKGIEILLDRGLVIAGRAEDAGGQPLAAAGLHASLSPAGGGGRWSRSEGLGARGTFRFGALAPGKYRLTLSCPGWGQAGIYAARTLEVEAGRTDIVVTLGRGKPIEGRVVLADGSVPEEGTVQLRVHPTRGGEGAEPLWASVDEKGVFRTPPLPEGVPHDVCVEGNDGAGGAAAREVVPGTAGVVLRLDPGKAIRGRVLDPDGAPLPGAVVWAEGSDGEPRFHAEAGADGSFVLQGVPDGAWRLFAQSEERNLAPGPSGGAVEAGAAEAVVRTIPGNELRILLVTADGKPWPGSNVIVETVVGGRKHTEYLAAHEGLLHLRGRPKGTIRLVPLPEDGSLMNSPGRSLGPFEVPGPERTVVVPDEE